MPLTATLAWIALIIFTACFNAWWRGRSVWYKRVSNETDRLSVAFYSVVFPPLPLTFMVWDFLHQDRHAEASFHV